MWNRPIRIGPKPPPSDVAGSRVAIVSRAPERRAGRAGVDLGREGAQRMKFARLLREPAGHALGLMALRSITIAAKFALTLFIARYLGLADLGFYGIIASLAALGPVLLGFGVANNLGREAARRGPSCITLPMLQYCLFLIPAYAALCAVSIGVWPEKMHWIFILAALLLLEQFQTDMFSLMSITGSAYEANVIYFTRFAGWSLIYVPLALLHPDFRNLTAVLLFWLAGCVVASVLAICFTRKWRWGVAIRALPRSRIRMPHHHGSMALYVGDIANTSFQYFDRYIVGMFLNPTILGVYVLYWSITNALSNLVGISIVQVRSGQLVKMAHDSRRGFNHSLRRVSLASSSIALGLGLLATLMMYIVVPHLGRPEADRYLPLMFILCVALSLRTLYEILGISFYAHGRDDLILYSVIGVLVVALALNLSLDPWIGIWGAGSALVASYAVGCVARALIIFRGFRFDAPRREAIGGARTPG